MHELSIVRNIIEIAEREVRKADANGVEQIELEIGKFAGMESSCLEFAWNASIPDSVLSDAIKVINSIPGKGRCVQCEKVSAINQLFDLCPDCQGYLELVEGAELKIKSLTLK